MYVHYKMYLLGANTVYTIRIKVLTGANIAHQHFEYPFIKTLK